jgi:hypothetical protein
MNAHTLTFRAELMQLDKDGSSSQAVQPLVPDTSGKAGGGLLRQLLGTFYSELWSILPWWGLSLGGGMDPDGVPLQPPEVLEDLTEYRALLILFQEKTRGLQGYDTSLNTPSGQEAEVLLPLLRRGVGFLNALRLELARLSSGQVAAAESPLGTKVLKWRAEDGEEQEADFLFHGEPLRPLLEEVAFWMAAFLFHVGELPAFDWINFRLDPA